jgi:hypothetical protein
MIHEIQWTVRTIHGSPLDRPKTSWMDISWISIHDPAGPTLGHGRIGNTAAEDLGIHFEMRESGRPGAFAEMGAKERPWRDYVTAG